MFETQELPCKIVNRSHLLYQLSDDENGDDDMPVTERSYFEDVNYQIKDLDTVVRKWIFLTHWEKDIQKYYGE